jgi:hypothetical protein
VANAITRLRRIVQSGRRSRGSGAGRPQHRLNFVRNPEKLVAVEAETPDHTTVGGRPSAGADGVPPGPSASPHLTSLVSESLTLSRVVRRQPESASRDEPPAPTRRAPAQRGRRVLYVGHASVGPSAATDMHEIRAKQVPIQSGPSDLSATESGKAERRPLRALR